MLNCRRVVICQFGLLIGKSVTETVIRTCYVVDFHGLSPVAHLEHSTFSTLDHLPRGIWIKHSSLKISGLRLNRIFVWCRSGGWWLWFCPQPWGYRSRNATASSAKMSRLEMGSGCAAWKLMEISIDSGRLRPGKTTATMFEYQVNHPTSENPRYSPTMLTGSEVGLED